jgi:putative membrane protein
MWNFNYPIMGLVGILMMLFWLAVIVAVIFLFIKVLGENRSKSDLESRPDKALETLNERYSKGEIDDEEYLRRKKNLLS